MLDKISILIVTYKGDGLVSNLLSSIAKIDPGNVLEIVVVDNSPSPSTARIAKAYSNVRYVAPPPQASRHSAVSSHVPWLSNPGFAGGNNLGWRYCTREYVLLLNNNTIVHSVESLTLLVNFMKHHPSCGAVQGTITLPGMNNCLGGLGGYLTQFGIQIPVALFTPQEDAHELAATPARRFSACGAYLMISRAAVAAAGGFLFRSFFWCYYEEVDLCHRLWVSGYEVWYLPTPPVEHLMGRTAGKFKHASVMARYLENQYFSLLTCLEKRSRRRIIPCFICILAAYGAYHLFKGNVLLMRASWSALMIPWRLRKRILAARRQINRIRRVSDESILPQIIRKPSLSELLGKL